MYLMNKVFMEYLDKLVVIFILVTYLSTRRRKKNHWAGEETFEDRQPRRKNYTNHLRQEVNFRIEDQVYLQATPL